MGFKPSKQYLGEIKEAMTHRPNQLPLIGALGTPSPTSRRSRRRCRSQAAQAKQANGAVMGAGAAPGAANPPLWRPEPSPGMAAAPAPAVITPTTP